MIATHIPKFLNARLKQHALRSAINGSMPPGLLHSGSVKMRRHYWAAPLNAADQKKVRAEIASLPADVVLAPEIPDLLDGRVKQLLMPRAEWRNDDYLSITPVASAGVMHEVYRRLHEKQLPFRRWMIQPTVAAWSNHGEIMSVQAGSVRILRRGVINVEPGRWRGNYLSIEARVQSANISSGMVSVGWPAISAIGGLVHTIEREIGEEVRFAVGLRKTEWVSGVRGTHRVGKGVKVPIPDFVSDEIMGHLDVVILIEVEDQHNAKNAANKITRIAGGTIIEEMTISSHFNEPAPDASYLYRVPIQEKDALDFALNKYYEDGEWRENPWRWWQSGNGYTLSVCGYALLCQPRQQKMARGSYLHAWAEPVFALVNQSSMSEKCWWKIARQDAFLGYI